MADAYRDANFVPTLIAVSNTDGQTPIRLYADPTTHRLLVDNAGGSAGTAVNDETPSGTINGVNKIFTLAHTPLSGTLQLFQNGLFVHPTSEYSLAGSTITYVTAPAIELAGLPFTAVYRY